MLGKERVLPEEHEMIENEISPKDQRLIDEHRELEQLGKRARIKVGHRSHQKNDSGINGRLRRHRR